MRYPHYLNTSDSDIHVAFLTAIFTVLGSVIILVLQRFAEQIYFVPINNQKEVIQKVSIELIKYAKYYANPEINSSGFVNELRKRDIELATDTVRELSASLIVSTNNINAYKFWYTLRLIKVSKKSDIDAAGKIMALSNSLFHSGKGVANSDLANKIRDLLCIPKS